MSQLLENGIARMGSAAELARALEVSPQLVSDIRRGRTNLEPAHAMNIALLIGGNPIKEILIAVREKMNQKDQATITKIIESLGP